MVNIRKFLEGVGLIPKTSSTADTAGEIEFLSSDNKFHVHNGTTVSPVVTEAHTATLTNKSIDADTNTITNIENADIKAAAAIDASKIADGSVSSTEFQYLANVTSDIQTQLNTSSSGLSTHISDTTTHGTTGDIVGTSDTQTLTNKTVNDDTFFIQDNLDNTKKVQLQVSGITTATTRTLTIPDADTTLVGIDTTQTLTNKTIDGDNNTVQDLALTSLKTNLTDASKFVVRDASGIVISNTKAVPTGVVVGDSDTQTLTNKTLTSPLINTPTTDVVIWDDQTTPANPSAGFYKTYFKSDGKLYKLNSAGVEAEIGSGSASPLTTKGDLYTYSTVDARLPVGTNGYILTPDSAETTGLKWQSQARTINAQTGTTYTFVLADGSAAGGNPLVTASNASAQTYTVPPNSSVAFPVGTQIDLTQLGAGAVTLAQGAGVTINSKSSNKTINGQYVGVSLVKLATDTWLLLGDLTT